MSEIAQKLLSWFDAHGRHDLPWQHPRSAYRVWIAEIMLQQTQVQTVIPYFDRFMQRFPALADLAQAPLDDVLALWSGLGYYSRARNLHTCAQHCVSHFDGKLPSTIEELMALPGIGRSTAGAILAQAHGQRVAILDGNVKRVLGRVFAVEHLPNSAPGLRQMWQLAEDLLPESRMVDYTQAIMDFGATLCKRSNPLCSQCPLQSECSALQQSRVADFPVRVAKKKALPQKSVQMLVVRNDSNQVLLQKRAAQGIWASLWSLPESRDDDELAAFQKVWGTRDDTALNIPSFAHRFSHFVLHIEPKYLFSQRTPKMICENDSFRWIDPQQAMQLGLPKPIRHILECINES